MPRFLSLGSKLGRLPQLTRHPQIRAVLQLTANPWWTSQPKKCFLLGKKAGNVPNDVEKRFGATLRISWLCGLSQRVNRRLILWVAVLFQRGLQVGQLLVGFEPAKALSGFEHSGGGPA